MATNKEVRADVWDTQGVISFRNTALEEGVSLLIRVGDITNFIDDFNNWKDALEKHRDTCLLHGASENDVIRIGEFVSFRRNAAARANQPIIKPPRELLTGIKSSVANKRRKLSTSGRITKVMRQRGTPVSSGQLAEVLKISTRLVLGHLENLRSEGTITKRAALKNEKHSSSTKYVWEITA